MVQREDVRIGELAGWWLPAQGADGPAPVVVMAHGFSLTRHDGLLEYAEAFAAAGAHVLVFDHRHLGDSGGEPRQRFRIGEQQADWRAAVAWARARADVDGSRVVLWGYSFSGGHVVSLVAGGLDVQAAMVVCPFTDGLRRVLATPPRTIAWLLPRAVADLAGRHVLVPVTAPEGGRAAMPLRGEAEGFAAATDGGSPWRNEISPGVLAVVAFFRPVARARRVRVPLWVGVCRDDVTVSVGAARRLAQRAPQGELYEYAGDHFAPFVPGATRAQVRAAQVAFLEKVVRPRP